MCQGFGGKNKSLLTIEDKSSAIQHKKLLVVVLRVVLVFFLSQPNSKKASIKEVLCERWIFSTNVCKY